jgi:transposase
MTDLFWFSDNQWTRIGPLLPKNTRGLKRVDDRRVLSGIVHVLKSGGDGRTALPTTARRKLSTIAS